jgi:hypothetical protein
MTFHCPLQLKGLSGQHDCLQIPENSKEENEILEGISRYQFIESKECAVG